MKEFIKQFLRRYLRCRAVCGMLGQCRKFRWHRRGHCWFDDHLHARFKGDLPWQLISRKLAALKAPKYFE